MMAEVISNFRLVLRLVQDARVPTWIKVGIPLFVIAYFVSPIDLIPDFLIGPGQLDDLGVILLGMSLMVRFSPNYVVEEHKRALGLADNDTGVWPRRSREESKDSESIEGEYRVVPPKQ